jgi:hypothetical protein
MAIRYATPIILAFALNCNYFDPNSNCYNPKSSCFVPQTVAPYVIDYTPLPNRGSNLVEKLTGIQVTFSQKIKGWLRPEKYDLKNFGTLQIASVEEIGTYTVQLNLTGRLANGNVDLSFPRLSNYTDLKFAEGTSVRLIGNLDIGVQIQNAESPYFVSAAGGTGKSSVVIKWSHDFQIDPQNNNSYALKVGGSSCADAAAVSGGTNSSGTNLLGKTEVTSTIPVAGNFGIPGTYALRICVQNNSGFNKSGETSAIVVSDSSAPTIQANIGGGVYGSQQTITFTCYDNCKQLAYNTSVGSTLQGAPATPVFAVDGSVSNGSAFNGQWTTPYNGDSTYSTISVVAFDYAGNQSAPLTLSYQINSAIPVISLASPVPSRSYVSGTTGYNTSTITWQANQSGNYQVCLGGSGCAAGPTCGSGSAIGTAQPYNAGASVTTEINVSGPPALQNGSNTVHICVSNGVQVADSGVIINRSDAALTVVQINPADIANAVPSAAPVTVTLSSALPLDLATVTTNTTDTSCSGTIQISSASDNFAANTCLPMTAQPAALSSQAFVLYAAGGFVPGIYKVRVTTSLKDVAGNSLTSDFTTSTGFAVSGLLRQFTFNNDSTDLTDRALTGNQLTLTGTLKKVNGVNGEPSGAYRFDGTGQNFLSGLDSGLPPGQAARTLCAWINPAARCANNCVAAMYGSNSGAYIGNRNATIGYGMAGVSDVAGSTVLKLNTWTHICEVYDGNNLKTFLNGIEDAATTATATTTLGSGLFIGKPSAATGQSAFYGRLDDVRIYAGALTASAMRQMAVQVPVGLEVYYSFSDAQAQTAVDYSSNGHNGTLTGSPAAVADRFGTTGAYNFSTTNQYISANDTALPSGTRPRTLCTWLQPNSLPSANTYATALRYGNPTLGEAQTIGLYNDGTATKVFYGAWGDDVTANFNVTLGSWMHVCTSYDGKDAAIYVNGTQLASAQKNWSTTLQGAAGVFIGQGDNSGTSLFNGAIDDVRIYSRVLQKHEIVALSLQLSTGLTRQYSFLNGQVADDNGGPALSTVGSPTLSSGSDGSTGTAFNFNGSSQYLSGSDTGLPAGNAARTLCARMNPVNVGLSAFALSYGSTTPGENSFLFMGGVTGVSFGNLSQNLTAPISLPANSWSHICSTYDTDGKATIYLNGSVAQGGGPTVMNLGTVLNGQFRVGARSDSTLRWAGKLDDIRIYSRALTPVEISELEGY